MSIIIYHPDGIDDVELGEALQAFYKQQFLIIGWDFSRLVPLNSLVCAALPHGPDGHIGQERGHIERIIHLNEAMKESSLSQPAFRYYENRLSHWVAEQRAPFSVDDALSALVGTGMDIQATQDMKYKSAIRLQNGGINMSFVQDNDNQTLIKQITILTGVPLYFGRP